VIRRILLLVGIAWVAVVILAYLFQRRLMYFPDAAEVPDPHRAGLEDTALVAADGTRLRAWYWPGRNGAVLLFLHGNAGDRGDRLNWVAGFHALGWGVFLLDYRGYGGSEGSPSEAGLAQDADAAADFLRDRGVAKVVYFGESIGCGVATALAARRPPAALVLQGGASSVAAVAARHYRFLPIGLIVKDRYDAAAAIGTVPCPVLSIHGSDDGIVPIELGRELHDAAKAARFKEWYEIEGAGHNDVAYAGGRAYYTRVHDFLTRAVNRE